VFASEIAYDIVNVSGMYPGARQGIRPIWPEALIEHFKLPREDMEFGIHDIMIRAHIRGEEFVNQYRPVILQVASELLAHGSLYGTHVRDLVDEHEAGSTQKRNARRVMTELRVILTSFIAFNVFYDAASIMPRRPPLFGLSCTESRDNL